MILEVENEADTKALGARLGELICGGETIELVGDVGAGKTTLVKGLATSLGIDEDIQSPSFTISRVYEASNGLSLVHYDFYRLSDAGILTNELAENQASDKAVTVIEWADIVEGVLPVDRLIIELVATGEESRRVELKAGGNVSAKLLRGLG